MKQSHLTITFTTEAAERAGLRLDEVMMYGMDDVLDLIDKFDLIGQIEHRELVIRTRTESAVEVESFAYADR